MGLSFFPSFFDRPLKIKFSDQEPDEHIEILVRRHWATNIKWIVVTFIGLILPFILIRIDQFFAFHALSFLSGQLQLAFLILWYMFLMAYVIESFIYWYFNIYIVTNIHLIDIELQNLLNRHVTEVRLDDVQSARAQVNGIFGQLFNFGDLVIETAAERQKIDFLAVPKPDFVKDRIQDMQHIQEGVHSDVT